VASSKRRPSEPSPADPKPSAEEKTSAHDAALTARVFKLFDAVLQKFERRVEDPDYRPSPSDIVGVAQALKATIEVASAMPSALARVESLKVELEAIQNKLLGILTASE